MKKFRFISLFLSIIVMLGIIAPGAFAAENGDDAEVLSNASPYVFRTEKADEKNNTVKVWLELDPAVAENVASYQVAIQFQNMNSEAEQGREMTLEFDESIKNAKVKATKYDKDTQTLRVYVADKENLVKTEDNANILPIGTVTVEKTKNMSQNSFKIVLFGNDGELAVADLGCNVKKAADVYGEDFVIPVDGTVYGIVEDEKPTEPTTKEEPTTTKQENTTAKQETTTENSNDNDHSDCSCICHKNGIFSFIYKIMRFFWRILSKNPTCECGVAHY